MSIDFVALCNKALSPGNSVSSVLGMSLSTERNEHVKRMEAYAIVCESQRTQSGDKKKSRQMRIDVAKKRLDVLTLEINDVKR